MSDLGRVVVLAGGFSYEREVSLRSGRRVAEALRGAGVDASVLDSDAALLPSLRDDPPAAVFVALHGSSGEDGAVRGVLDLLDIPYVGARADACRMAFDKPAAKAAMSAAGVATAESVALPQATFRELGARTVMTLIVERLGLPLMVKPARGGSALGASAVRDADALPGAMVGCFSYSHVALVERYLPGIEVAVSVLDTGAGPQPLPPVEIRPNSGSFDYAARYTAGMTEYHTPARLDAGTMWAVQEVALVAHRALDLRDLSRTDLIVTGDGPAFLEVNTSPGMTETSLFPMSAAAAGVDLGMMCRELLHLAADRRRATK